MGLQDTLQLEPIIRLLEHESYLVSEQIDELLDEESLEDMVDLLKTDYEMAENALGDNLIDYLPEYLPCFFIV
ncbi:MAG: hypothetical protein MUE85_20560 [Microscillaceae bacterium]|nr:hypothetical protein [Microscillaceae bacterium]